MNAPLELRIESQAEAPLRGNALRGSRNKSAAAHGFSLRCPSLTATIVNGLIAAMLTTQFDVTLQQCLELTAFLTIMLGLPEAIASQSMTESLLARGRKGSEPVHCIYGRELWIGTELGILAGGLVGLAAFWQAQHVALALIVGASLTLAIIFGSLLGILVPRALSKLVTHCEVWSAVITLAATDIATLTIYFSMASIALL